MPEPRLLWDVGAELGEGPVWMASEGVLRFVDIKAGNIHAFTPSSGFKETLAIAGQPTFVFATENAKLIAGAGGKVHLVAGGLQEPALAAPVMPPHNRTNDACVDTYGRLWFGTMDDEEVQASGSVYCLDRGVLHQINCRPAIVTNGPALSADASIMYVVDSTGGRIFRYSVSDDLSVRDEEVFVQIGVEEGFPDGVTLDSEDCLWVALWDGWAVRRYAPNGKMLTHIDMPCARVTKVAFGGADLCTAFVTTARVGLTSSELAAQPQAGGLFAFDAPVPGRTTSAVRL